MSETSSGQLPLFGAPEESGAWVPSDHAARVFATDPRHNVVLEASAGTGKTTVLVGRYALEWQRLNDGVLLIERELPNKVKFGVKVIPGQDAVRMEMWITNGSPKMLTGLRVQNCVMLKAAKDFSQLSNDNKVVRMPYAACRNSAGDRWIITAWEPCVRPWTNPPCPCMHSDPQFPDCKPGETQRLVGWLSFFEGQDIQAELKRIEESGWSRGFRN